MHGAVASSNNITILSPLPGCHIYLLSVNIHTSLVRLRRGALIFRNLMCLDRWLARPPSRTQRYIRTLVMSSSPLLTITESHGFRALLAAVISIIGAIHLLGRGLRNLACRKVQPAQPDAGPSFWARILLGRTATARRGPVLWFDTSGGRASPIDPGRRPQPLPVFCDQLCNLAISRA